MKESIDLTGLRGPMDVSKNLDGTESVSKQTIIKKIVDVLGFHGEKWKYKSEIENTEIGLMTVLVKGSIEIPGTNFTSGEMHGACSYDNKEVFYGDAIIRADNVCFRRCAGMLGMEVIDSEIVVKRKVEKKPESIVPAFEKPDHLGFSEQATAEATKNVFEEKIEEKLQEQALIVKDTPVLTDQPEEIVSAAVSAEAEKPIAVAQVQGSSTTLIQQPNYFMLVPHIQFINSIDLETHDYKKMADKLSDIGVSREFMIGEGGTRLTKQRLEKAIEIMKKIVAKGSAGSAQEAPVANVQQTEAFVPGVVQHPSANIQAKEEPQQEVLDFGSSKQTVLNIGPAPRGDFAVMADIIDKVEARSKALNTTITDLLKSKGLSFVNEDDFVSNITQEQFDSLFV